MRLRQLDGARVTPSSVASLRRVPQSNACADSACGRYENDNSAVEPGVRRSSVFATLNRPDDSPPQKLAPLSGVRRCMRD